MTSDDDGPADQVQTRFGSDQSPSEAVVRALAAIDDTEPESIEPVYHHVEPDALDKLFERSTVDDVGLVVTFRVMEYHVVVRGNGTITVRDGASPDEE